MEYSFRLSGTLDADKMQRKEGKRVERTQKKRGKITKMRVG